MRKYVQLGDIAKIYSGGTPSRTNSAYWGGNIPWVKTSQIQNCVISEDHIDEWITEDGLKHSSTKMIPKGTILMAMYGQGKTRGQVAILGLDATINQACAAIELGEESNRDFVYQQLLFRYNVVRALSNTGSQENLSAGLIREIKFPFPAYVEQSAIASLLTTWDLAIEMTDRLIAAKKQQLLWLQDQLIFTPARSNGNWKHLRMYEIADRVQRKSDGGTYPILTISSASGFVLQKEKYSRFMAGKSLEDYILLRRGEFAYNKGNSFRFKFGCVFPLQDYVEALVPHVYVCFSLRAGIDARFLGHVFQSDYLKRQLNALVNTGVRNNGLLNISPVNFMKVTVPLPPMTEQNQIAEILTAVQLELHLLKKQAEEYRKQKRGLMQKLLTGKWQIKMAEETL